METLSGKKAFCFIALPHHNRFLVPIMEALVLQGMEMVYFTAAAEGAFEITLNQAKLPYRHVLDYADEETAERWLTASLRCASAARENTSPIRFSRCRSSSRISHSRGGGKLSRPRSHAGSRKPDLLFAFHELNPWGKILGHLSHLHRIPYFTLQEGLYYADIHYYRFHTDFSTACLVRAKNADRF